MTTSEVEVSAKDKKKSKKDRDKRSEDRTKSDKDKEALEWAIKKSQKEERKRAKEKDKEDKEMAKVLEQSRLEAEVAAKELKSLSCTPDNPTPLLTLGARRNLIVCDVHGNMHVSASPPISSERFLDVPHPEDVVKMFPPSKSRLLAPPLDRSSESKDSRAPDALDKKSSECTPTRESKNSFVNSGSVAPESLIPSSEAKSDAENEINLFTFPQEGDTTACVDPGHSPLLPPAPMNSSSSDHEHQDVKQEPLEGPYVLDPNDEFDLRNGVLKSDISDCLQSSSENYHS